MNKLKSEIEFINLFLKLARKYNVKNFYFNKLKKSKYVMLCEQSKNEIIFSYYFPFLLKEPLSYVTCVILHEIGHTKNNFGDAIKREYFAEKWMLNTLKKDYPKFYPNAIKDGHYFLDDNKWKNKFPKHYKAFSKIKEYTN
jgi:hypothetical protein